MNNIDDMTRREALGLFKAVAVLGAGLMVSKNSFGSQGSGLVQQKHIPLQSPYTCDFFVFSGKLPRTAAQAVFSVALPPEMVKMLSGDPHCEVQIKLNVLQQKGQLEFGQAQVKLNQGVIQSKAFLVQDKWFGIQDKLGVNQGKLTPIGH